MRGYFGMCLVNILMTQPFTVGAASNISDAMRSTASRNASELRLPCKALGALDAGKLVHGGITDLTVDRLAAILHGELERQTFAVVSYNSAPCQRHRTTIFQMASRRWRTSRSCEKARNNPIKCQPARAAAWTSAENSILPRQPASVRRSRVRNRYGPARPSPAAARGRWRRGSGPSFRG